MEAAVAVGVAVGVGTATGVGAGTVEGVGIGVGATAGVVAGIASGVAEGVTVTAVSLRQDAKEMTASAVRITMTVGKRRYSRLSTCMPFLFPMLA